MAKFIKFSDKSLTYFQNKILYKVEGTITIDDIEKISKLPKNTVLLLRNTRGQSSKIIKLIPDYITISVIGGLDYINKRKYKDEEYIKRTLFKSDELSLIIEFFEKIEQGIRHGWTPMQKCMYVYESIVNYFEFAEDTFVGFVNGFDVTRSLKGILYGRMVCAGFALLFKEMMDRIGIPCLYQNMTHRHSWNVVELDNKVYGLDITWDCTNKNEQGKCDFLYFGTIGNLYDDPSHNVSNEDEEKEYHLSVFTAEQINSNIKIIHFFSNASSFYMHDIVLENGEKISYRYLYNSKKYSAIIVYFQNSIFPIYIKKPLDEITNSDIIVAMIKDGHFLDNESKSLNKNIKKYVRVDNSEFLICKIRDLDNGIKEFYYIDVEEDKDGNNILNLYVILSELDLESEFDINKNFIISNELLSRERVIEKNTYFKGYVGYIKNGTIHIKEKIEKILGIIR